MQDNGSQKPQDEKEKKTQKFIITTVIISSVIILIFYMAWLQRPTAKVNDPFQEFSNEQAEKNTQKLEKFEITNKIFENLIREGKIKKIEEQYLPGNAGYNIYFTINGQREKIFLPKTRKENFYDSIFAEYNVKITPLSSGGGGLFTVFFWIAMIFIVIIILKRMGIGGQMNQAKGLTQAKTDTKTQKVTFDDVAGCDEAKAEIKEVVDFLKDPENFTKLGAKMPGGVILVGPPGCGKTLLAKAVANEADVPFHSMSGSQFVQMFIGVGAARVRDLFDKAEKDAPCIVFIDEIESIGRKRGSGFGGGGEHEIEQTLNELLQRMDGFSSNDKIVILGATNQPDKIDPALMRPGRMDRQVVIGIPDLKGRLQILNVHAKNKVIAETVDLSIIAKRTTGLTGADLANILNEGAIFAARKKKDAVEIEDIEDAIDKVTMGIKQGSRKMSEKEKRLVAYHEAGHTLVAEILEHADPVHKVSIIPRGIGALGQTMQLPQEDKNLHTKNELQALISVLFGGRVAEKIMCGEETSGAANDLERASQIAKTYVKVLGMDEKIGLQCFGSSSGSFVNTGWLDGKDYSEKMSQMIDEAVSRLLAECLEITKKTIEKNKDKLEKIFQGLMEKETLTREDLNDILK